MPQPSSDPVPTDAATAAPTDGAQDPGLPIASVPLAGPDGPRDPAAAVRELADGLLAGGPAAVAVVFADAGVDRDALAVALAERFGDVPVVACTTAGELEPGGYASGTLTGFALPAATFRIARVEIPDVRALDMDDAVRLGSELGLAIAEQGGVLRGEDGFAFMVVDGLAAAEETIAFHLQAALGEVPLFGASAGDGLRFRETGILLGGRFRAGAAVCVAVQSKRPFALFRTQHVEPLQDRLVITAADAPARRVMEINGAPAAEEYARLVGVAVADLVPEVFARHPVLVRVGGGWYVRSIQQAEPDGSLISYCAIDEGLVLTLGRGGDMVADLETTLEATAAKLGGPVRGVLAFDCILRRLEAEARGLEDDLARIFGRYRMVGFHTYGEQCGNLHVNQTCTGVMFG